MLPRQIDHEGISGPVAAGAGGFNQLAYLGVAQVLTGWAHFGVRNAGKGANCPVYSPGRQLVNGRVHWAFSRFCNPTVRNLRTLRTVGQAEKMQRRSAAETRQWQGNQTALGSACDEAANHGRNGQHLPAFRGGIEIFMIAKERAGTKIYAQDAAERRAQKNSDRERPGTIGLSRPRIIVPKVLGNCLRLPRFNPLGSFAAGSG